mmetsp:Transcript_25785/g.74614  ORF Transcript_25785/g.74614 Transcript_25785/m.74614 type:complete len:245 (+) Transcript_25785:1208-1942(+)
MLGNLGVEIVNVDIALIIVVNDNYLHASHGSRGWVGAVGRLGDKTDVTMTLTLGLEVTLDGEQAGILARRTRIRLCADGGEACDLGQIFVKVFNELVVTLNLLVGSKGMNVTKSRPCHGDHLASGVEFHCAGAKRNHGMIERQVTVLKGLEVAKHLCLGMVDAEDGMLQNLALSSNGAINFHERVVGRNIGIGQTKGSTEKLGQILASNALSHADTDGILIDDANIGSNGGSTGLDLSGSHSLR